MTGSADEKILVRPVGEALLGNKGALACSAGLFKTSNTPPEPRLKDAVVVAAFAGVVDQENCGVGVGACAPASAVAGLANILDDLFVVQENAGACVVEVGLFTVALLCTDGAEANGFVGAGFSSDLPIAGELDPFVDGGFWNGESVWGTGDEDGESSSGKLTSAWL